MDDQERLVLYGWVLVGVGYSFFAVCCCLGGFDFPHTTTFSVTLHSHGAFFRRGGGETMNVASKGIDFHLYDW
jgi:hypothetical protein